MTYALMIVEYGLILEMFVELNLANTNWMHASSLLLSYQGEMYQTARGIKHTAFDTLDAKSALAGLETKFFVGLWNGFKEQGAKKMVIESLTAAAVLGGLGTGAFFGSKHSSSVNATIRKELEAL